MEQLLKNNLFTGYEILFDATIFSLKKRLFTG